MDLYTETPVPQFIVQDKFNTPHGERVYPTEIKLKSPSGKEKTWETQTLLNKIDKIRKESIVEFFGEQLPTNEGSLVGQMTARIGDLLDDAVEESASAPHKAKKQVELIKVPNVGDTDFESIEITQEYGGSMGISTILKISNGPELYVDFKNKGKPIIIENTFDEETATNNKKLIERFRERIVNEIGYEVDLNILTQSKNAPDILGDDTIQLFPSLNSLENFMDVSNSKPEIEYGHPLSKKDLPLAQTYLSILKPSEEVFIDIPPKTREMLVKSKDVDGNALKVFPGLYEKKLMDQIRASGVIMDPTPPRDFVGKTWDNTV